MAAPGRKLPRPAFRARSLLSSDANTAWVGDDVCSWYPFGFARHWQWHTEGFGDGHDYAPSHEGFHNHKQLYDRGNSSSKCGYLFRAGRYSSTGSSASRAGDSVGSLYWRTHLVTPEQQDVTPDLCANNDYHRRGDGVTRAGCRIVIKKFMCIYIIRELTALVFVDQRR